MIYDAYIATRGLDFLELRIITDTGAPCRIRLNQGDSQEIRPVLRSREYAFYRALFNGLPPQAPIVIEIWEGTRTGQKPAKTIRSATLPMLSGYR